MNLIMSPTRNSLAVKTVSCLLFGKLVGPPLQHFNPAEYVKSWLMAGKHSADDTNSKVSERKDLDIHNLVAVWKLL